MITNIKSQIIENQSPGQRSTLSASTD